MPHELDPRVMFPETADFWKAASENRLLVKRCESCGKAHFYPRVHCPFCHSPRTQWEETRGAGTIYSFSVQRGFIPPVATAMIEVGHDIRLQSVIVEADLSKLRIGQEVRFAPIQGGLAPEVAFTTPASIAARQYAERAVAATSVAGTAGAAGNAAAVLLRDRMLHVKNMEARQLLLEGATPQQVDKVLVQFGMPAGCFATADAASEADEVPSVQVAGTADPVGRAMIEAGRAGRKVGKGFYKYEPGSTKPEPDAEVLAILESLATRLGIQRRPLTDEQIEERLTLAQIHEGLRLLQQGLTRRPGDIDAACLQGCGWPAWRGGPMYCADQLGMRHVRDRLEALAQTLGDRYKPCDFLVRLVREGRSIA